MAAFDEFWEAFNYNPDTFDAEQFKAAITSAHEQDTAAISATLSAKDQAIADHEARIKKLGEDNWKLLMKQGPSVDDTKPPVPSGDDEEHKPKSIDQMFKKVERKV